MKMKPIFMLILLLLLPTMAIANAAPKGASSFKYKAVFVPSLFTIITTHYCGPEQVITRMVQVHELETYEGEHVGTMTTDFTTIMKLETTLTTGIGRFVIEFDAGPYEGMTIEGTIAGKIVLSTGEGDIKFVGHGDMHVQGALLPTQSGVYFLLEGYSW